MSASTLGSCDEGTIPKVLRRVIRFNRNQTTAGTNIVVRAASVVFATSFLLLNLYFAWDSRLLLAISPSVFSTVFASMKWEDIMLWNYFDLVRFTDYAYIVTDLEAFALLIVLIGSSAWLSRSRGLGAALLRSAQVAAFCLVIFEVELALFDCSEFFIHVTDFQVSFNLIPWFSNADMLFSAVVLLATSTFLLNRQRLGRPGARPAVVSQAPQRVTVDRRNLGRFLILFLFGILFVVGGWAVAYYGGVWRFSYSTISSVAGNNATYAAHYILTSYSQCHSQLRILSAITSNSSCSVSSLNSGQLTFVVLGGISMLMGLFALRKRPTVVAERVGGFLWLLPLVIPLFGGIIGYVEAREKNEASALNMIVLGIETFLGLALLLSSINLIGFNIPSACTMSASPYSEFVLPKLLPSAPR